MKLENKFRQKYNTKSNRLQNHDYGDNGGYFITVCTKNREHYFGEIIDGKMILNDFGKIIEKYYLEIEQHFPFVILDEFVIMPNHMHGIIIIDKNNIVETRHCIVSTVIGGNRFQNQGKGTISSIIGSFKSVCTKTINSSQDKIFFAWQPNYYDRVIRNENEFQKIQKYIVENPLKWELDKNNVENIYM